MKIFILLLSFLFLISCAGKQEQESVAMNVDLMAKHPSPSRVALQDSDIGKRIPIQKLIKEGFVEFETSDAEKTKAQIMCVDGCKQRLYFIG
jgi:hypothetical protein